ncbi:Bax inhibitor 1 [Smittium mucronatum]|uniref:Bax inhibitor 1 n=1 Tax=Smittium mucronatum TaxID=133383 RepID=A0A1R0GT80_9FUNG|nr:Bax inhibitor 1 [Smittium mucronatum]
MNYSSSRYSSRSNYSKPGPSDYYQYEGKSRSGNVYDSHIKIRMASGVFVYLTLFTYQSKYDFTSMGSILLLATNMFLLSGLLSIFFPFLSFSELTTSLLGVALFSGYIVYDTFIIAKYASPDDYVMASIKLYLDFINVFIYIVRLLNERKESKNKNSRTAREVRDE